MNRQEYLKSSCSVPYATGETERDALFLVYYRQIPNDDMRLNILAAFSKHYRISEVKREYLKGDVHLNMCTSINIIDAIAAQVATASTWNRMFQKVGDFDTLAGRVCVVKTVVIDYITGGRGET